MKEKIMVELRSSAFAIKQVTGKLEPELRYLWLGEMYGLALAAKAVGVPADHLLLLVNEAILAHIRGDEIDFDAILQEVDKLWKEVVSNAETP